MWKISVKVKFDAAHQLQGYTGKCAKLHGHTWTVIAVVEVAELDPIGMGIDFSVLKQKLGEVVERYDHSVITLYPNPTAEVIAREIFRNLKDKLLGYNCKLVNVCVHESPDTWVEYIEQ